MEFNKSSLKRLTVCVCCRSTFLNSTTVNLRFISPFLDSQASHLAFPFKSRSPGLSGVMRRRTESWMMEMMWVNALKCQSQPTRVDIPDHCLFVKAIQVQQLLVRRPRLHLLHVLCDLLEFCLQTDGKRWGLSTSGHLNRPLRFVLAALSSEICSILTNHQSSLSLSTFHTLHRVERREWTHYSNVHINQLNTTLNEKSGPSILVMVQTPGNLFPENNRLLFWTVKPLYPGRPKVIHFTEDLGHNKTFY